MKRIATLCVVVAAVSRLLFSQAWADRSEYDLALSLRSETVPANQLALISQWRQKYPKSSLKIWRAELELDAARDAGDWKAVLSAATEIFKADPDNFNGSYWTVLLTPSQNAPVETLETGVNAARKLVVASTTRPPAITDAEWQQNKMQLAGLGHKTLGWVDWQKKSYATAESELRAALDSNQRDVEISAWLGTVLALQKTPQKQLESIWHLARAVYTDGDQALTGAKRRDARSLLEAIYVSYHGSADGIDAIGQQAVAAAAPPLDFKIESAAQVAQRLQDEELVKANPDLANWVFIKRRLQADDGQAHLRTLSQTAQLLKGGVVVRTTPNARPKEIGIGIVDPDLEEIVLKLEAPFTTSIPKGAHVEFIAMPESMTTSPFALVMTGSRKDLVITTKPQQ